MSNQSAYLDRPPRIQPVLPVGVEEIPAPPKIESRQQPMWQLLVPLVSIGGYVLVTATGQGSNIAFLIPMMLGVLVSSGVAAYTALSARRLVAQKQADYVRRLAELRKAMVASHEQQRAFYQYTYPDIETALAINGIQRNTRSGSRLWERRNMDQDFGAVRIGLGTRPSTMTYRVAKADNDENPQMRDAERLAEDSAMVSDVPITLALYQIVQPEKEKSDDDDDKKKEDEVEIPAPVPHHAVGISGTAEQVYPFAQAMAANLLAFHAPDDMQLFVVGRHHAESEWDWITALPHCRTGKSGMDPTWHFEGPDGKHPDKELDGVAQFWKRRVWAQVDQRAQRLRDQEDKEAVNVRIPFLLIIVDLLNARVGQPESSFSESALRDLESEAAVSLLLKQGAELGAAIIFLVPERSKVPSGCEAVIELTTMADQRPGFLYAEVGLNTTRYVGVADALTDREALKQFASALAAQRVRRSYGADMPTSVNLLDLYGVESLDALRILDNWERSMKSENADWLEVPLGQLAGGEPGRLKLAASASGVHGMVAGSTGSGKSELLMTFIISLAIRYDPRIVNFVLIDFKGGATFDPFDDLPHKVDKVTNLSPGAVARMFAAINAELNRRQEINRRTACKDIIEYRKRGYHHIYEDDRYSTLFIIIDEFAEMISNNPEYRAQLESITRLGRSLGVNLLLAAQRPTGVSDQMRANIKFRICLRVETREESRELLHRPDASFLPTGLPGRGYLQIGNENLQEIQVAFSGSEYLRDDAVPDLVSQYTSSDVIVVDDVDNLWRDSDQELPRVYSLLVLRAARLQAENNIPLQQKPWPNPLPKRLTLTNSGAIEYGYLNIADKAYLAAEMRAAGLGGQLEITSAPLNPALSTWLDGSRTQWPGIDNWDTRGARAAIGIIDNPAQAEMRLLLIDLTRGHHAIFGASGWGKTTLLRSLLVGLAATHSPDELRLYFLDFGGRQLRAFENMPHTSAYILPTEGEKVRRLLRTLEQEIDRRSQHLSTVGKESIADYNDDPKTRKDQRLPAIVVVIDNFAEFRVTFESQLDVLTALIGTGLANGVYFVVTGTQVSSLGKLFNQIPERLTLKLADDSEYASVVGRGARFVEETPGRGFRAIGRTPLEFQVALPLDEAETASESESSGGLAQLIEQWRVAAGTDRVRVGEIQVLAEQVFLDEVLQNVPPSDYPEVVFGIQDDDLAPARVNLRQKAHFIISGAPTSGKTTALYTCILSLAERFSPQQVAMVLVDSQGKLADYGGQKRLDLLPHVLQMCITDPDKFRDLPALLRNEYENNRSREIYVIFDNYDDIEELTGKGDRGTLRDLGNLARRMGARGLHFVVGGSSTALRSADEFTRLVAATRFGLATDLESAGGSPFSGKVPVSYSSSKVTLPVGRSFLVMAGRVAMLQSAMPYRSPETLIEDLDAWVTHILARNYPKAQWQPRLTPPDSDGMNGNGNGSNGASVSSVPIGAPVAMAIAGSGSAQMSASGSASTAIAIPANLNLQKCRAKLATEAGMPADMLGSLPGEAILEMMQHYSISYDDCV